MGVFVHVSVVGIDLQYHYYSRHVGLEQLLEANKTHEDFLQVWEGGISTTAITIPETHKLDPF